MSIPRLQFDKVTCTDKTIMASMFPEELSLTLLDQIPCRALQIRQLLSLLSVRLLIRLIDSQLITLSSPFPVPPPFLSTALKRQERV